MSLFSSEKADNLHELLLHELKDLYDAEHRILEALPKMAAAATNPELATAFRQHIKETEDQVVRLEDSFNLLNEKPQRQTCDAMKGLLEEGEHVLKGHMKGSVKDAALISAAQRVEHYEIAAYGTAHAFAVEMGHDQVAELLQKTLDEEGHADKTLTKVSKIVNAKANVHTKEIAGVQ